MGGQRDGDDGPNEWLVSRRRDAKGEVWSCGFLYLVSCSLSEVRSGRFEGRGLGVSSRLETGRRGNGRSGQRVGDRHCLSVAASGRTTVRCLRVCSLPCCCRCQIESMDDDQSRETRSIQLAATCLASWVVNGESVGGELEEKGECLPSLPCLPLSCLAQLACLVLAWLRFGAGRSRGGGVCGCTVLLYGYYAMRSTDGLYIGGKPRLSNVGGGCMVAGVAAALILDGGQFTTQHGGHAGTVGAAGAGGRHERTNGNGHGALGIHTEPRRPQHGDLGREGEGARASRSSGSRVAPVSNQAGRQGSVVYQQPILAAAASC